LDEFPVPAENSLFLRKNSLFSQKKSLFRKEQGIRLQRIEIAKKSDNREFDGNALE
jgi:hypothetical protein